MCWARQVTEKTRQLRHESIFGECHKVSSDIRDNVNFHIRGQHDINSSDMHCKILILTCPEFFTGVEKMKLPMLGAAATRSLGNDARQLPLFGKVQVCYFGVTRR